MGRAGGVAGVGQPGGEVPARVKLSFNYNDAACISIKETGCAAGTGRAIVALAPAMRNRNTGRTVAVLSPG